MKFLSPRLAAFLGVLVCSACAACASAPASRGPVVAAPALAPAAPAPVLASWTGSVNLIGEIDVPGQPLPFFAQLELGQDPKSGTLDIPAQGARGVPLLVTSQGDALAFALGDVGARWEIERGGSEVLACRFSQGAITLPCTVREATAEQRAAAMATPRPQTPKPPFPYEVREVSYDNPTAKVSLAGTLTLPPGDGPFPAVLLITGSGTQDRDETLFEHKPFLVLADHLARHGIAALRVDDRGVGGSTAGEPATLHDLALDVEAGFAFLKKQPHIDARRVGLIGHSEGGLIAPLVASRDKSVAFLVLLAGPSMPGSELLVAQVSAVMRSLGAPDDAIEKAEAQQRAAVTVIATEPDDDKARVRLREILGEAGEGQIEAALTPRFRALVAYDPRPALERVRCPVLALYGALDTQVPAEQNVPEAEQAFKKGKNRHASVRTLDGLNHLLQPAKSGAPTEYPEIPVTMDPSVLELATTWIHEQSAKK